MSGNGCPKCDGAGGDEAWRAILGPGWSEQTQTLLRSRDESRQRNRNGERKCQITEHNRTGVENVASKCPLHLHCCILPRSKVQIHPLLLLQKQQILSRERVKYS